MAERDAAFVGALVVVGMLADVGSDVGALVGALVAAGTFVAAGTVGAAGGVVGICAVGVAAHAASSAISSAPRTVRAMRRSATWGLIQHAPKRCSEHLFKGVIHHLSGI